MCGRSRTLTTVGRWCRRRRPGACWRLGGDRPASVTLAAVFRPDHGGFLDQMRISPGAGECEGRATADRADAGDMPHCGSAMAGTSRRRVSTPVMRAEPISSPAAVLAARGANASSSAASASASSFTSTRRGWRRHGRCFAAFGWRLCRGPQNPSKRDLESRASQRLQCRSGRGLRQAPLLDRL